MPALLTADSGMAAAHAEGGGHLLALVGHVDGSNLKAWINLDRNTHPD